MLSTIFIRWTTICFMLAGCVPLINCVVDPFYAFGSPMIRGFNAVKPSATHRARLSKAHSLCRAQPDVVIFGSSRAEFIFDPQHPAFEPLGLAYNFSLAGSGVYEIRRALEHAYFAAGIQTAIVTFDFHMFNAYRERNIFKRTVIDYDETRLVLSERDSCLRAFFRESDVLLFSAAALWQSYQTIIQQETFDIIYRRDGARDTARMNKYRLGSKNPQRDGFGGQVLAYMEHVWFTPPWARFCFTSDTGESVMDDVRGIIRFAREHDIDLKIVLTPEHAVIQRGLVETGLWPLYEDWRRILVAEIEADAQANPEERPFALWDFAGYDPLNTEPLPPSVPSYEQHMRYWYEGTHSQLEAGNLIVDKIFGYQGEREPIEGFGVRLDASNIDAHILAMREGRDQYARENPDIVAWVKTLKASVPTHETPRDYCSGALYGAE